MSTNTYTNYYAKINDQISHSNHYKNYYVNHARSGISGYEGTRFQRGSGFFGNIFRSAILPLLKYLGKKAANTGIQIASDALSGQNMIDSIKSRGKAAAEGLIDDAASRATRFIQTGKGGQRKRKRNGSVINSSKVKRRKVNKSKSRNKRAKTKFALF